MPILPAPLPRTLAATVADAPGSTVRVCGWAEPGGSPASLVLRDHTGRVRLVDRSARLHDTIIGVVAESAVEAVGTGAAGPSGDGMAEIALDALEVVGPALGPLPISEGSPVEERMDWRFLDLRHRSARLVFEVQTTLEEAMRERWRQAGFLEIHSPKIRATANRSGRELFTLDYFGRPAYLAQSPQFAKQMAMAAGFDRVFEVGPAFRANPVASDRHDTEFTSVDVEMAWISSHEEVMTFEEGWLAAVIAAVAQRHGAEVERCLGTRIRVPEVPFPRVSMAEAHEILGGLGWAGETRAGNIDLAGERLLARHVAATTGHDFVFLTGYGAASRPFYHMRVEPGSAVTRGFDLLWKGIEVTTGAQREHRHEQLSQQAGERGIEPAAIRHYLDYFRFGCPPHGGFGLGLTRVLMALLDRPDVRQVTYLHRDARRLAP